MAWKAVANNLRKLLEKHGVRQTELSKVAGVSVSLINKVINNRAEPNQVSMAKIARGLSELSGSDVSVRSIFPTHG